MVIRVFQKWKNKIKVQMEKKEKGEVSILKWMDMTIGELHGSLYINKSLKKYQH